MSLAALHDLRIKSVKPLLPAAILLHNYGIDAQQAKTLAKHRADIAQALKGDDDRLLVLLGPTALPDNRQLTLEYAKRLKALADQYGSELILVMRAFVGTPSPAGADGDETNPVPTWKGMVNDPDGDGSYRVNEGLQRARGLLLDVCKLGLPVGTEYADTLSPQFIADLVSWSCISARSAASPLLRELASGLSTPVGFHNANTGFSNDPYTAVDATQMGAAAWKVAVDAVVESAEAHAFLSVSKEGVAGIVETSGNRHCHVILHGSEGGTNHDEGAVRDVSHALSEGGMQARVMVDCGSFNAAAGGGQLAILEEVSTYVARGNSRVFGVMLHSILHDGTESLGVGGAVNRGCMGMTDTEIALAKLASAVKTRRNALSRELPPLSPSIPPLLTSMCGEAPQLQGLDNLRVRAIRPLMPPACIIEEMPVEEDVARHVFSTRCAISAALQQVKEEPSALDRLVVIAGPTLLHDARAAMEFAARLATLAKQCEEELIVVMRVNLACMRPDWKDPAEQRQGQAHLNRSLREARQLLLDINRLGLPVATDYFDTITPQFVGDLVSWAAVAGKLVESDAHRELASGLSTPVGFHCPDTDHGFALVDEAVRAGTRERAFLSVSKQGVAGIVMTCGNGDCHSVLPSCSERHLSSRAQTAPTILDCGGPLPLREAQKVAEWIGQSKCLTPVFGVVVHSFLLSGKQKLSPGYQHVYGMSVGEACIDWSSTEEMLNLFAQAARERRSRGSKRARTD